MATVPTHSRVRPDFYRWRDMRRLMKSLDKEYKKMTLEEHYMKIGKWFLKRQDHMSAISARAEWEWYKLGNPYYKVWPSMVDQLSSVSIDIDATYLHLPFST